MRNQRPSSEFRVRRRSNGNQLLTQNRDEYQNYSPSSRRFFVLRLRHPGFLGDASDASEQRVFAFTDDGAHGRERSHFHAPIHGSDLAELEHLETQGMVRILHFGDSDGRKLFGADCLLAKNAAR